MKADLHIHSNFSDGTASPEEIVKTAIKKGINCICISDHDEIEGAIRAMKYGFDKDILIVPGIEVLSSSGDILGINVKKKIPKGLSPAETIKEIRKQGGMAVIPHPFGNLLLGFWGGEKEIKYIKPDALEVFNASVVFPSANKKAFDFIQKNKFCLTAGSDAHKPQFIGRGYIETSEKISSERDLLEAILQKKVRARGKQLTFLEIVKNSTDANIKSMIKYCHLRRKNHKKMRRI